ncbi:MAG: histidine phosphatase family protein [Parvibaculum sedimenti]|uniref:histidine phosphatase family protein n=1 Tax=Parvibaculum sedimenti TaxID=2608632 RepID=UPI003BB7F0B4
MSLPSRTDWIWIRHAPVQGQESRYYGQLDVACEPVNPVVASVLARQLPPVAVWMATPMSRTRATALALKPGVDPIEIPDLNEQHYGLWQGRSHNDVYAASRGLEWTNPAHIRPPEGESFADLAIRVAGAVDRLTEHYAGHSIIAVAHATTIRAAIGHALGLDPATSLRIEIAPLSLTRLNCRIVNGDALWGVGCINFEVPAAR